MDRGDLRRVLEGLPAAVMLVDAGQRIVVANRGAAGFFGAGLEGRQISAIIRHPDFLDGLDTCLTERRRVSARLLVTLQGNETHLAVTFAPMPAGVSEGRGHSRGHGGGLGALITVEDLTVLEQAVAMRRDFVANVSHELRTPLTALVGFIETLRGPARDDPAARERFLAIMERESGRMIRLVNDLLSLSRVEAEERRRPEGAVAVIPLLEAALATHDELAAASGVELTLEAAGAPQVRGDPDQLTQVFHNLIENAIKYGGSGKRVTLGVTEIAHEPGLRGPAVEIAVVDLGEGIDPLHLPRLTERFYRVDSGRSRLTGGTGLGLAIVKHIVNRHRGRLRIESEPGRGSRFTVILPAG